MYASMARTLNNYWEHPGKNRYDKKDFHSPYYVDQRQGPDLNATASGDLEATSWLSAASIFQTFDVLKEVYRPGEESGWKYFSSSKKIAWKTGTSFGFRDAWAIGVTPHYTVGVWVGNADGEGRPGLTGTDAAAPAMFSIFDKLQEKGWFSKPLIEMKPEVICKQSGHRATSLCESIDTLFICKSGSETKVCPYHKKIHISKDHKYRVHS